MNREVIDAKVKEMASIYSSTILDKVVSTYPNLNPVIIEIIKELSEDGFTDGATVILDMLEESKK